MCKVYNYIEFIKEKNVICVKGICHLHAHDSNNEGKRYRELSDHRIHVYKSFIRSLC